MEIALCVIRTYQIYSEINISNGQNSEKVENTIFCDLGAYSHENETITLLMSEDSCSTRRVL